MSLCRPRLPLALLALFARLVVPAQDVSTCNGALAPTIETSTSDYSVMQSYIYVNAALEYDRLQKMSSEDRDVSATYKLFSAEYNESKAASEFLDRVRRRLSREGFQFQAAGAKSGFRRSLTDKQLDSWSTCVQRITGGGAIFLSADAVSNAGFPLRAKWFPGTGIGNGVLVIKTQNAVIDGKARVDTQIQGVTERRFIVKPDSTRNQVVVTAEIRGAADDLVLPRTFPAARSVPDSSSLYCPPVIRAAVEKATLRIDGVDDAAQVRLNDKDLFPGGLAFNAQAQISFLEQLKVGENRITFTLTNGSGAAVLHGWTQLNDCPAIPFHYSFAEPNRIVNYYYSLPLR